MFQEEIFGPCVSVTTFKTEEEALQIAKTPSTASASGCGRGTATGPSASPTASKPGASGALLPPLSGARRFGGYKQSGIGPREPQMMLDHYQQIKNMLVSYSGRVGFF